MPEPTLIADALTQDQERAFQEITGAMRPGSTHCLTGAAGTGKTFLMNSVAQFFHEQGYSVALTAPTHKAVAVLDRKQGPHSPIPCLTIHKLLSLQPYADGENTRLKRTPKAKDPMVDVVVVDEASMANAELMHYIDSLLYNAFVLYVGDPAQLPPVNEAQSRAFLIPRRSHLEEIVRQARGNPVLEAAHIIRASQGGPLDWSWVRGVRRGNQGVFLPDNADRWMERAFTSTAFHEDNDTFRYLCWTNRCVAEVNAKVRRWLYGDTPTPFVKGERVLLRQPVIRGEEQVFATNEEAPVLDIGESEFRYKLPERGKLAARTISIPSWGVKLRTAFGGECLVHIPQNPADLETADRYLVREAKEDGRRWQDRFDFKLAIGKLSALYGLTVHNSQSSTFGSVFVDMQDIRKREYSDPLEMTKLLYVAATRPTTSLMLVNL